MKKRPWHLWLVALFVAFMYAMGCYDFVMMLTHNAVYYVSHGYGPEVVVYFTNYPFYFLICWVANLLCGFVAPILLILKKPKGAKQTALMSAIADALLLAGTFALRNRFAVLGANIALFDIFILAMTFAFYLYCGKMEKQFN